MTRARRAFAAALLVVGLFATVGAATPVAALATIPCPAAVVCTYDGYGFSGDMYYYSGPFNACITIGSAWSGRISSVINNKSIPVRLYYNICSSNWWNKDVGPNDESYTLNVPLDGHVHSIWIGFEPPH